MSNQNQSAAGNGCSLEDCYTNLFALTDFADIHYRKYTLQNEQHYGDPLDNPLLTAFARCQEAGLLSAWTRAKRATPDLGRPYDMNNFNKELWVFWYGDAEPTSLKEIILPELKVTDRGNWTSEITYECRTMLFKALHNVVERCLLKKGFVRLGKWFVQPYRKTQNHCKSPQYSISFSFFLHGESTVCASLDVRQLPPVRYLSSKHLVICNNEQMRIPVILAPYGLNAQLSGRYYFDEDAVTSKFLERWLQFYPLKFEDSSPMDPSMPRGTENAPPRFVEVIFGGYRMRYPSCYVLLGDRDLPERVLENLRDEPSLLPSQARDHVPPLCAKNIYSYMGDRAFLRVHQDASLPLKGSEHSTKEEEKAPLSTFCYVSPSGKAECRCRRISCRGGHALSSWSSLRRQKVQHFHRRNHMTVHAKERLDEVDDNCNRHRAPPLPPVSDPTMPTLSPQPPTLEQSNAGGPPVVPASGVPESNAPQPVNTSQQAANSSTPAGGGENRLPARSSVYMYGLEALAEAQACSTSSSSSQNSSFIGNMECLEAISFAALTNVTPGPLPVIPSSLPLSTAPTISREWPPKGVTVVQPPPPVTTQPPSAPGPKLTLSDPWESWLGERVLEASRLSGGGPRGVKRSAPGVSRAERCPLDFMLDADQLPVLPDCLNAASVQSDEGSPLVNAKQARLSTSRDHLSGGADAYEFNPDEPSGLHNFSGSQRGKYAQKGLATNDSSFRPESLPGLTKLNSLTRVDLLKTGGPSPPDNIFSDDEEENGPITTPLANHVTGQTGVIGRTTVNMLQPNGKTGSSLTSSTGSGPVAAGELSRMFPTPPSLENHTLPSPVEQPVPCASLPVARGTGTVSNAGQHHPGNPGPDTCAASLASLYHQACPPVTTATNTTLLPQLEKDWSSGVYLFGSNSSQQGHRNPKRNLPLLIYDHRVVSNARSQASPPLPALVPLSAPHRLPFLRQPFTPGSYPNAASIDSVETPGGAPHSTDFSPASTPATPAQTGVGSVHATGDLVEAHSLYLNLLLADSMLNVFKDHNFDSCNICECNMSVQGGDVGLFLPGKANDQRSCKCGFSALMNKRYVENSNLFFEDKEEVTGVPETRTFPPRQSFWRCLLPDADSLVPPSPVLNLIYSQLDNVYNEFAVRCLLDLFRNVRTLNAFDVQENELEYKDACAVCRAALEQARHAMDNAPTSRLDEPTHVWDVLHRWFYFKSEARLPDNHSDQIRLLKAIRPWLQEAIGATRLLESSYTVDGPLTWKDFHQLAGRGSDESCEPQPLPQFVVCAEREGMTVSPFALQDWERLSLEPFSHPKDIAYAVVTPDHLQVTTGLERYFRELSHTYEASRLGRHLPFSKDCAGGLIRLGTDLCEIDSASGPATAVLEDWLRNVVGPGAPTEEVLRMIRVYTRGCRQLLTNTLRERGVVDKSQFPSRRLMTSTTRNGKNKSLHDPTLVDTSKQLAGNGSGPLSTSLASGTTEFDVYLVIYLVNPFTFAADHSELHRLAVQALTCCAHEVITGLPELWRSRVSFQVLPLGDVVNRQAYLPRLKAMAFSTYTQTHRLMKPSLINANRTLTGMGPAAEKEEITGREQTKQERRIFSPAYILAGRDVRPLDPPDRSCVLLCAYCLSEDQRWLLAACTDAKGSLLEHVTINITIPDRHRRKKASARRIGLAKLWEFLVGVVAQSVNPWRLVIGRMGRLGHGELKGWNGLLGRKNLLRVNNQFREQCSLCNTLSGGPANSGQEVPSVISACLVSLEMQSSIRVYPSAVRPEERASSGIPLTTPKDASATHILVFPTSTSASAPPDLSGGGAMEIGNDLDGIDFDICELSENGLCMEVMDFDMAGTAHSPGPFGQLPGVDSFPGPGHAGASQDDANIDPQDEETSLMQQPLAMGYYVSTASPGPLPAWFWSPCPQASRECPSCFKAALHLQTTLNHQDDGASGGIAGRHLLDSSGTCDVLRFVLEAYNSLSWLTLDPTTNDRRSCLPLHILCLLQLYHAQHAFL